MEKIIKIDEVPAKLTLNVDRVPAEVLENVRSYIKGRWEFDQVRKCLKWTSEWNGLHKSAADRKIDACEYWRDAGRLMERKRSLDSPEFPFMLRTELSDDFLDKYGRSYRVWMLLGEDFEVAPRLSLTQAYRLGFKTKFAEETLERVVVKHEKLPGPLTYHNAAEYKQHLRSLDTGEDMQQVNAMILALKETLAQQFPETAFITDAGQGLRNSILISLEEIRRDYEKKTVELPPFEPVGTPSEIRDMRLLYHLKDIADEASESWRWK